MRVQIVNPEIAYFIRHLIVALHLSQIIWLYNEESAQIVDSLIAAANITTCRAHNTENPTVYWLNLLGDLPIGPQYVIVFVVSMWPTLEKYNRLKFRYGSRYGVMCRHVVMFVDGQAPSSRVYHSWFIPSDSNLIAEVRFPINCTADEAVISPHSGNSRSLGDFLADHVFLASIIRGEFSVSADNTLRVTMVMSPLDCIKLVISADTNDVVVFGRDVAIYRLLAERMRSNLEILHSQSYRDFNDQAFSLKFVRRPLWLRSFIAEQGRFFSTDAEHMRKSILSASNPELTTMPFRYSHYAIVVPFDLVVRKRPNQDRNSIYVLVAWLLTIITFAVLRQATSTRSTDRRTDLFLDTMGRALGICVTTGAPLSESTINGRSRLAVQILLVVLTLYGMLVGSMCVGIFYDRRTELRVLDQRIRSIADLCASELLLGFEPGTPSEMVDRWKYLCPEKSHRIHTYHRDIRPQEEAFALPYEELKVLTTSKMFRDEYGRPMLYILEEKLISHNYVMMVHSANMRYMVERLLLRFAAAGLLQYFDRMAEFVCRLIEGCSIPSSNDPWRKPTVYQHFQLLETMWVWMVYLMGNLAAICWFIVERELRLLKFQEHERRQSV